MNAILHDAVYTIPVSADLNRKVLAACRQQAAHTKSAAAVRYAPALATAAACAAVLGVTFAATGQLPFAGNAVSEASAAATEKRQEEGALSKETATPQGSTTSQAQTTDTTQKPIATSDHLAAGTTSDGQRPSESTTTRTTVSGTPTATGDNAACRLLIPGRVEKMTEEELTAHYGRRYLPTRLPADMVQPEIYIERGIYYKDESVIARFPDTWEHMLERGHIRDAEVIYDENSYDWYSMENADRCLMVHVSTAPYPQNLLGDVSRFDEAVTVAGVEVLLHYYDDSPYSHTWSYSAVATVDGVAFYVSAWEFTREEFLDTLASLLEK